MISVDSKRRSGGEPVIKLYAARIADPDAAMAAVKRYANIDDEHAQILVEASVSQLRGMRVPDRKVRRIGSISKPI